MKLSMEDRLVNIFKSIKGIFDIYRQSSKDVAVFVDFHCKLGDRKQDFQR